MGSDVRPPFIFFSSTRFNSRSRMGSDGIATFNRRIVVRFQFALPHGERRIRVLGYSVMRTFQFALPHGERRIGVVAPLLNAWFQFALPHGERPSSKSPNPSTARFQFALPHGERLIADQIQMLGSKVSIRAPAWGATRATAQTVAAHRSFNSRSRMGSDDRGQRDCCTAARFNSRSRMGSDRHKPKVIPPMAMFQFALPHGERH